MKQDAAMNRFTTILPAAFVIALAAGALCTSCKTTEENYRAAYEKTIAAKQEESALEATIYGKERRQQGVTTMQTEHGEVEVRMQLVRLTDDGGGSFDTFHRYCVVVGQFKQIFNAKSLRNRLVDAGYPGSFIVETAEPYYYIVLESYDEVGEAAASMERFRSKGAIAMREPCPFILSATVRRPAAAKTK